MTETEMCAVTLAVNIFIDGVVREMKGRMMGRGLP